MRPRRSIRATSVLAALVLALAAAGGAPAPSRAAAGGARLPVLTLTGQGEYPSVAVDAAGNAYFAWDWQSELKFCRIPSGYDRCVPGIRSFDDDATAASASVLLGAPTGNPSAPSKLILTDETAGGVVDAYVSGDGGQSFQSAQIGSFPLRGEPSAALSLAQSQPAYGPYNAPGTIAELNGNGDINVFTTTAGPPAGTTPPAPPTTIPFPAFQGGCVTSAVATAEPTGEPVIACQRGLLISYEFGQGGKWLGYTVLTAGSGGAADGMALAGGGSSGVQLAYLDANGQAVIAQLGSDGQFGAPSPLSSGFPGCGAASRPCSVSDVWDLTEDPGGDLFAVMDDVPGALWYATSSDGGGAWSSAPLCAGRSFSQGGCTADTVHAHVSGCSPQDGWAVWYDEANTIQAEHFGADSSCDHALPSRIATVSTAALTAAAGRRPRLSFTVRAGASPLVSLALTLPRGVSAARTARSLRRGVSLPGHPRPRIVAGRGIVTIALSAPASVLRASLTAPAITVSHALAAAGRRRHAPVLQGTLAVTDTTGTVTTLPVRVTVS